MNAWEAKGKAERREDIVAAAKRVFSRKGIVATTMDDVALEADTSKGGLYRLFASKDELFFTVAIRAAQVVEESVLDVMTGYETASGLAALRASVAEAVRYAKEDSETFNLAVGSPGLEYQADDTLPLFSIYQGAVTRLYQLGVSMIARGQNDGSIRTDISAERLGTNLWGAVVGSLQIANEAHGQAIDLDLIFAFLRPGAAVAST